MALASASNESDLAFLSACAQRMTSDEWRAVMLLAQVLSDRIFPEDIRAHLIGIFEGMVRCGARIAFATEDVKEAYQRAITHPDVIAVTLLLAGPGSLTVQGIRAETKFHDGRDRRRPKVS